MSSTLVNHFLEPINGTECHIFSKLIWNETITEVAKIEQNYKNEFEKLTDHYRYPEGMVLNFGNITKVKAMHIQDLVKFPAGLDKIFPNLISLVLAQLGIKNVHQRDLAGFPKLNYLDLSLNQLTVLEKDLFKNNPFLMDINLRSNELKIIDPNIFSELKYLEVVNILDNFCITIMVQRPFVLDALPERFQNDCKVKVRPVEEAMVKGKKKFKWKKYFWYFVIFGSSFSFLAIYCLARMLCIVKVAPEDVADEHDKQEDKSIQND